MSQAAWENIGIYSAGIITILYQRVKNWGANWHCLSGGLVGQGLSFALVSTGGQTLVFKGVMPEWWQFGQTFTTYQNFDY
ncbi:expansin-A18-like [Miscanthus floridulus]|uniref:expansin-A18-like n=1 Tax=Miscanthus floridulus TaxID=154761 RepID=UPI003458F7D0